MADPDCPAPSIAAGPPPAAATVRLAPRPHDLLWLRGPGSFVFPPVDAPVPAWAADQAVRCDRPVVVRRAAPLGPGWVPVGLRGATRGERCAAHAYADDVLRTLTPEDLARGRSWRLRPQPEPSAAVRLLDRVAPLLDASPFDWGICGGVGYALTGGGAEVLRPESDLDLLVRASSAADAPALRELAAALGAANGAGEARIDVQVETPLGAFSLAEWSRGDAFVMLRTTAGPRLVADPWQGAADPPATSDTAATGAAALAAADGAPAPDAADGGAAPAADSCGGRRAR